jgi:hypothetical protein
MKKFATVAEGIAHQQKPKEEMRMTPPGVTMFGVVHKVSQVLTVLLEKFTGRITPVPVRTAFPGEIIALVTLLFASEQCVLPSTPLIKNGLVTDPDAAPFAR